MSVDQSVPPTGPPGMPPPSGAQVTGAPVTSAAMPGVAPAGGPALEDSRPSATRPVTTDALGAPRLRDRVRRVLGVVTGTGWFVAALGVASWVAGYELGWLELMYVATAALAALVIAVPFIAGRARLDVEVELQPQRVVVGGRAAGQLTVTNPGTRRVLGQRVDLAVGAGAAEFEIPSLAPGASDEELFVLPTERRAVIPVGPATVVWEDPLGLLRRSAVRTEPIPLFVHPRTVPLGHLGAGMMRDLEGQPTADLSPSDIAFHAMRDYEPGDDRRFVHWLTTARVGKLMVRQFLDTRRAHLAVLLDGANAVYDDPDDFETAVSVVASVGVRAISDDQGVSMWASGRNIPCASSRAMLDALAGVHQRGRHSQLPDQVDRLLRTSSGVSLAIVVTGSRPTIADLRALTIRFPIDVRTMVIRIAPNESPGFRPIGSSIVLTLAELSDLGHLLWAVTRA